MAEVKVAGIFGRTVSEGRKDSIRRLYQGLISRKAQLCIYEPFYKITRSLLPENAVVHTFTGHHDIDSGMACMLTIGGDGTLLEAVKFHYWVSIPAGLDFFRAFQTRKLILQQQWLLTEVIRSTADH
jgi:NAD kinase